jgi:hypothetical protein
MRRFADPTRCPSCSTPLTSGSLVCQVCLLDLHGPLGQELFTTLQRADALVDTIRQRPQAVAQAAPPAAGAVPQPTRRNPTPAQRVRATSVPAILLGLGAVCLLVAALVFLAVTWSQMGVGGRTTTLVVLTLTTGALTGWAAARALRGATEALGVVTLGLAVLDLYGANSSGWLGELSGAAMTTVVGAFLVAAGIAATSTLARTAARGFVAGELAVVCGALLLSGGLAAQGWGTPAGRLVAATVLVMALLVGVWSMLRTGSNVHRLAAWGLVPVPALDWLALVATGIDSVGTSPTVASTWGRLEVWPLLAAAALAMLVAVPSRVPLVARVLTASLGIVPLSLAVLAPAWDEPTTTVVLALVALTVVLAALMAAAPAPWGAAGALAAFLGALGLGIEILVLSGESLQRYVDTATAAWEGTATGRVVELAGSGPESPWLLPVCVAALTAVLRAGARLTSAGRSLTPRVVLRPVAAVLAASGVATLLLHSVPVWTVLLAALALTATVGWSALTRDDAVAACLGGAGLVGAVVLSWYDEHLNAAALLVSLALVLVVHARTRREHVAAAAGALATLFLAGLTWTAVAIAGGTAPWSGVVTLLVLTVPVLGRHRVPLGLQTDRVHDVLEIAAVCAAAVATLGGVAGAPLTDQPTWTAVHLTIVGACASALSLVRRDRRQIGWLGGLLLLTATWVRLEDLGVHEPEPYTLPAALALLVVGLVHLRRDPSVGTLRTLGAGLGLALAPSLLWVLEAPTGLRALLLGLACLGLVVAGVQLRWAAPVVYGAAVGLVLVLREAAPYLGDTVPRWALIGAAGAVLIAMGVTWERRLKDARMVSAYVHGLR